MGEKLVGLAQIDKAQTVKSQFNKRGNKLDLVSI